jgi:4-hydroxythreonine-4-phosphate dehydrogenase
MTASLPIALTIGDPAGIGPELVAQIASRSWPLPLLAIGDVDRLRQAALERGIPLQAHDAGPVGSALVPLPAGQIYMRAIPSAHPARAGQLDPANADAVLAMIDAGADGALAGHYRALVTGPVHKGVINDAGHPFSGHTERLAERAGLRDVLMLLVADDLRVALVTTHVPLRAVAELITTERVESCLRLLDAGLKRWFGIARPDIAVLGLNPHAGEGGHMGDEEQRVLIPLLRRLARDEFQLSGPLPADTAFVNRGHSHPDAYLAMYHDQGLPVLKYAGFGSAVNVTLGLPYLRTSVDHGTALDIAGRGVADPGSLLAALNLAMNACQLRDGST